MDTALEVKNLTKIFKLYHSPAERVKETFHPLRKIYHTPFTALKNVGFKVNQGETVGIVGRNGSGKSTLLQIICSILQPNSGQVIVRGRVAALLELGAGFNPEFTGRQNVYINAAIQGLSDVEINSRFDEILDFAEIGEFIDQPVKTYSSGMYVRLAFGIAINIKPDILIVDEALAVGDEIFQRKCFARIQEIKNQGTTILFVSHALSTINEICNSALLFDQGELLLNAEPKIVVSEYQKLLYTPADKIIAQREKLRHYFRDQKQSDTPVLAVPAKASFDPGLKPKSTILYDPQGAQIENVRVTTLSGQQVNILKRRENYYYCYDVRFKQHGCKIRFGMLIKTVSGIELGGAASSTTAGTIACIPANALVRVRFKFKALLQPGVYFLNAGVLGFKDGKEVYLHRLIDSALFKIQPVDQLLATVMIDFMIEPEIQIDR